MNRNQLILLLVALAVIGGAGLMLLNRHDESWSSAGSKLGQKLLPDFKVNDVADIHIKGESDLNLVKKDNKWRVAERNDYPANFSDISDLLIKMGDLKIAQDEPIGPSQLGRMQLAAPGSGVEAATLVEFKDAQGKVIQSLLLGKKHVRKSERASAMPYGGGDMPDGRYVMLKDNSQDLLTVSDPLNSLDPKPAAWLDKDFFKIEKLKTISFVSTNATNSWTLTRATESSPWVLLNLKAGEVLDSNKVSSLSSTLSYPSFVDVAANASPAQTGMDKPLLVNITTFDHFDYALKIGSKTPENNYNLQVSITGDFPANRVPEKNETADAAKKLDAVFQDNLKVSQDKVKHLQSFDDWTYLVSSWTIDPLIRDRSQLMVEKAPKEDTKGAAKAVKPMSDDKTDGDTPFPPPDSNTQ